MVIPNDNYRYLALCPSVLGSRVWLTCQTIAKLYTDIQHGNLLSVCVCVFVLHTSQNVVYFQPQMFSLSPFELGMSDQ